MIRRLLNYLRRRALSQNAGSCCCNETPVLQQMQAEDKKSDSTDVNNTQRISQK